MQSVTEKAPAKINLYLDITSRRPDGYHEIKTVMQSIPLYDIVTVSKTRSGISMTCTDGNLTCGDGNLCIKAARAFFSELRCDIGGCKIELEKHIPMQAGLGGGSSDAAAVLRALNRLHGNVFDEEKLCELGLKLGADVPFCITGRTSLALGIGEILSEYISLPHCWLALCRGGAPVSTPEAYRRIDLSRASKAGDFDRFDRAMKSRDLRTIGAALYNRFEDILPDCIETKNKLTEHGAVGALLSGSGSFVYGIFESREDAERCCDLNARIVEIDSLAGAV